MKDARFKVYYTTIDIRNKLLIDKKKCFKTLQDALTFSKKIRDDAECRVMGMPVIERVVA